MIIPESIRSMIDSARDLQEQGRTRQAADIYESVADAWRTEAGAAAKPESQEFFSVLGDYWEDVAQTTRSARSGKRLVVESIIEPLTPSRSPVQSPDKEGFMRVSKRTAETVARSHKIFAEQNPEPSLSPSRPTIYLDSQRERSTGNDTPTPFKRAKFDQFRSGR
jgi:hypothetical protein